jgi:hypothetical protein
MILIAKCIMIKSNKILYKQTFKQGNRLGKYLDTVKTQKAFR